MLSIYCALGTELGAGHPTRPGKSMSLVPWKSVWGHLKGICWDKMNETYLYEAGGCCCDDEKGELIYTQNPSWRLKSRVQGGVGVCTDAHVPPRTGCECGELAWDHTIPGLRGQLRSIEETRVLLPPPALQNSNISCPRACGAQFAANFPGNRRYNYCNGWVRLSLLSEQFAGKSPPGRTGRERFQFSHQKKVNGYWLEYRKLQFWICGEIIGLSACLLYSSKDLLSFRFLVYQGHWRQ